MTDHCHDQTRTVQIPERIANDLAHRLPKTEFETIDEYTAFALERLVNELGRERDGSATPPSVGTDTPERDDDQLRKRLESLGYL